MMAQGPNATYQATRSLALWLKKIFEGFLPYMGMAAILVVWLRPNEQTFVPHPTEGPYEIWLRLAQRFWRRRSLKMVDGRWTDEFLTCHENHYTCILNFFFLSFFSLFQFQSEILSLYKLTRTPPHRNRFYPSLFIFVSFVMTALFIYFSM